MDIDKRVIYEKSACRVLGSNHRSSLWKPIAFLDRLRHYAITEGFFGSCCSIKIWKQNLQRLPGFLGGAVAGGDGGGRGAGVGASRRRRAARRLFERRRRAAAVVQVGDAAVAIVALVAHLKKKTSAIVVVVVVVVVAFRSDFYCFTLSKSGTFLQQQSIKDRKEKNMTRKAT